MKHTYLLILLVALIMISCNGREDQSESTNERSLEPRADNEELNKSFKSHSRLLNFKINLVNTIGDLATRDSIKYSEIFSKELNPKTDTVQYLKEKIYISCIMSASGCAEYRGDLLFRNDTIVLLLSNVSEIACTEMEEWRTIYEIENKNNKRYVIQKR